MTNYVMLELLLTRFEDRKLFAQPDVLRFLVLETMGLKGVERLPSRAGELLELGQENFPLNADWRAAYEAGVEHHFDAIVAAVEEAFAEEIASEDGFAWFDRAFIEEQVRGFIEGLDDAMDRWRDEYVRLDAERAAINRKLGQERVDQNLNRRRVVIERKLEAMRDGQRDWYLYRYLGGEGFLPGYAFPPQREVNSFLAPSADIEGAAYRVVLYETAVGGSGVLASLAEPGRLATVVERARELLHEGDPEGGCQKACYACLLSFYNQRDHEFLDRTLVLPWLQGLADADNNHPLTVAPVVSEDRFGELADQCQSELERKVLRSIRERGLSLPDGAQETLYDGDEPLAIADFFYEPKVVVFVDGSPHHRDYVQEADRRKRNRLKGLGYRITVVKAEEADAGLDELAARLG